GYAAVARDGSHVPAARRSALAELEGEPRWREILLSARKPRRSHTASRTRDDRTVRCIHLLADVVVVAKLVWTHRRLHRTRAGSILSRATRAWRFGHIGYGADRMFARRALADVATVSSRDLAAAHRRVAGVRTNVSRKNVRRISRAASRRHVAGALVAGRSFSGRART